MKIMFRSPFSSDFLDDGVLRPYICLTFSYRSKSKYRCMYSDNGNIYWHNYAHIFEIHCQGFCSSRNTLAADNFSVDFLVTPIFATTAAIIKKFKVIR